MYANAVNLNGLEGALLTAHSCLCLTKIIGEAVCVSPCDLSDTLRVFCALGSLLPCRAYYLATLPLSLARRTLPPPHLHAAERANQLRIVVEVLKAALGVVVVADMR